MKNPEYSRDAEAFETLRDSYSLMEQVSHEGRRGALRLARAQFLVARRLYQLCEQLRRTGRRLSLMYLK